MAIRRAKDNVGEAVAAFQATAGPMLKASPLAQIIPHNGYTTESRTGFMRACTYKIKAGLLEFADSTRT
jgi:hypothetical protein